MSDSPGLFDGVPLARTGDPLTSRRAAEEVAPVLGELQQWAAECVRRQPGKTQRELGALFCPLDPRKIGRRLNECERLGRVQRGPARHCTVSGKLAETWYPVKE